jgi:predicted PurR-regulated permease PerM
MLAKYLPDTCKAVDRAGASNAAVASIIIVPGNRPISTGIMRMTTPAPARSIILDSALRIGLVALLVYACGRIMQPFIGMLLWAVILAVMLHPLHLRLVKRLGNRWSATLIGIVGVALLMVPMIFAAVAIAESVASLVGAVRNHTLFVPPPPPGLSNFPIAGAKLTEIWTLVATNTPAAITRYGPQLTEPVTWLAKASGGLTVSLLLFLLSLVIADILLAYGRDAARFAEDLFARVIGDQARGARLVRLTAQTIRGVAQGVIGVALIQTLLIGIGFVVVGVPAAGILTLIVLVLAIAQVPALLILLPVMAYVFATEPTTTAVVFAVWSLLAGLSDNILKPLMLGRGLEVPMPVILIGVIGGMLVDGLVGLFIGPVVLAVGYVLLHEWIGQPAALAPADAGPPA